MQANRLSPETRRRYAAVSPQLKHRATARGKDPSHQSREESGERPSRWAELEDEIRRFARFSRTSPYPLLHRMLAVAGEEEERVWATRTREEIWSEWLRRCDAETVARGLAGLPLGRVRSTRTRALLGEAADRLYDHGDAILALVTFAPVAEEAVA
jgi:hypothetical protein